MTTRISNAQLWVHDQDEALAWYTERLGWEVRSDVTMAEWDLRWLVVGPPGQDDVGLVLMPIPGPPMITADERDVLASLVAKGAGGTLFLTTDDCQAAYADLRARGVEFVDPPTDMPYGVDAPFRDPSGNNFRMVELAEFDHPENPA